MIQSVQNEVQTFFTNTEFKHPEGDKLFIQCDDCCVLEFSMISKTIVHDLGQILDDIISSIARTFDNKSQFVCDWSGSLKELYISTRKQVNSFKQVDGFNLSSTRCCAVTHNNKYLITAECGMTRDLTKWSIRSKKQLHTWQSAVGSDVCSQSCSYDNKYQLIGHNGGQLEIFDLQKNQTLESIQVLSGSIYSVAFSRDNQSAFISDYVGNIKMIKWKAVANSGGNFHLIEILKKVANRRIFSISLTKDEKYLLVGSYGLVSVLKTTTRKVTKEFKLTDLVRGISLIKDGTKAIIAEENGNLSIIDLETLEISSIAQNITNGKRLEVCLVI